MSVEFQEVKYLPMHLHNPYTNMVQAETMIKGEIRLVYYSEKPDGSDQLFEMYSGPNYVTSNPKASRSYSRAYGFTTVPKKYTELATELQRLHRNHLWTKK